MVWTVFGKIGKIRLDYHLASFARFLGSLARLNGFVRAISRRVVTSDREEIMKNGFVRAICHLRPYQIDCHYGSVGFVRAPFPGLASP
jgi:hypothetical protein